MPVAADFSAMLPHPIPADDRARLLLFVIRRMAAGGLNDAHAAAALLGVFGKSYRRPLVLLRALMAELARAAERPIVVAPCCCPRMTENEATLLSAVTEAESSPRTARARLGGLLPGARSLGALSSAQAVNRAFADLGRPLA